MVDLIRPKQTFLEDPGEEVVIRHDQVITDEFLEDNKAFRDMSASKPAGDYHKIASIPTAVVEKWRREGFDILTDQSITAKQIVARLSAEDLGAFITTAKRV